jgi:hypothetical protein
MDRFAPRPLFLEEKALSTPQKRLCGLQDRPGLSGEEKNIFLLPGLDPRFLGCQFLRPGHNNEHAIPIGPFDINVIF